MDQWTSSHNSLWYGQWFLRNEDLYHWLCKCWGGGRLEGWGSGSGGLHGQEDRQSRGQGKSRAISFLFWIYAFRGSPSAPTCASTCVHTGQHERSPWGALAAVSSEPGALGRLRQSCSPNCDLLTVIRHLSVCTESIWIQVGATYQLSGLHKTFHFLKCQFSQL